MAKKRRWDSQLFTNITDVDISDITADPAMQQRHAMRDAIITEYMEVLQAGGELAPIKLIKSNDGTFWLWDGFHTLQAAKKLDRKAIKAEVEHGTKADAWLKSLGANDKHGIRRSKLDLYKAVDNALSDPEIKFSLLDEDKQYSFRSVAKLCAVGHQTISKRWKEKHLPRIIAQIDQAINSKVLKDEAFLNRISETLKVPHWLTLERWENVLTVRESEASEDDLTGGRVTTRQVGEALKSEASGSDLTGGRATAHQVSGTLQPEASEGNLIGGRATAHQVSGTLQPEASEGNLIGGRATTRQVSEALKPEASEDDLTGGRVTTRQVSEALKPEASENDLAASAKLALSGKPSHYSSQEAVEFLTGYVNKQVGVKILEAQRPDGGWTGQVGQEIDRALSAIVGDEINNVSSMLIVMVKD